MFMVGREGELRSIVKEPLVVLRTFSIRNTTKEKKLVSDIDIFFIKK